MKDENGFTINEYLTDEHRELCYAGKMVCSYNGVPWTKKRRSGTSTRIIDNTIQLLFDGKQVVVKDLPDTKKYNDGKNLGKRIIKRLMFEHHLKKDDIIEEKIGHYYVLSLKDNDDGK